MSHANRIGSSNAKVQKQTVQERASSWNGRNVQVLNILKVIKIVLFVILFFPVIFAQNWQ